MTKQYQKGLVQRISYCVRLIYADEAIVLFAFFGSYAQDGTKGYNDDVPKLYASMIIIWLFC